MATKSTMNLAILLSSLLVAISPPIDAAKNADVGSPIRIPLMKHVAQPSPNQPVSTQMAAARKTLCNRPGFSCKNAPHQAAAAAQQPLGFIPNTDISETYFYGAITIGTPGQPSNVAFSLYFQSNLIVPSSKYIKSGRVYNSSKSSTYVKNGKTFNDGYQGFLSTDTVTFAGLKIKNQTFVESNRKAINPNETTIDGVFGLGLSGSATPPFINMINQKLIPQPVFSLWLHTTPTAKSMKTGAGQLTLGGIDSTRYTGSITYTPLTSKSYWQIKISSVKVGNSAALKVCSNGCLAVVEPIYSWIGAPSDDLDAIAKAYGWTYKYSALHYTVNCKNISSNPNITFNIGGKPFTLTPKQYVRQVASGGSTVCIPAFYPYYMTLSNGQPVWYIGEVFLAYYYSVFDYGNKRIGFAPAKPNPI